MRKQNTGNVLFFVNDIQEEWKLVGTIDKNVSQRREKKINQLLE